MQLCLSVVLSVALFAPRQLVSIVSPQGAHFSVRFLRCGVLRRTCFFFPPLSAVHRPQPMASRYARKQMSAIAIDERQRELQLQLEEGKENDDDDNEEEEEEEAEEEDEDE
jgi:hypothetical protein